MLSVIGALFFALGLALSIALHEVGHLLPAKRFGVRVTQYMVGFGPTLWSRRRGETEYGIKAIPLGGYIRMIGMFAPIAEVKSANKASRKNPLSSLINDTRTQAVKEIEAGDEARTFYALSVPKKLAIMFGGPVTNLFIATILFGGIFTLHGTLQPTSTIGAVIGCVPTASNQSGSIGATGKCIGSEPGPAVLAGLKVGDTFVEVNGHTINQWSDFGPSLDGTAGKPVSIVVKRANALVQATVTPAAIDPAIVQSAHGHGFIGVSPESALVRMSPAEVPLKILSMTKGAAVAIIHFPTSVFHLTTNLFSSAPRDPQGPVSIVGVGHISGQIASSANMTTSEKLLDMTSLLASMNLFLFVFNMVPLLPLDGGHIAGALFEGVRRVKSRVLGRGFSGPSDTARMMPLTYAMSILMLLFGAIVIIADIVKPLDLFN